MNINEAHLIYFSPTHTSQKVAEAIVRGTGIEQVISTNITLREAESTVIPAETLTVIAVPVYGGHVAPLAMKRLQNIRGTGTPVVLVAVYGNRAYEKALVDLEEFAGLHGMKVIACATFIGEHSFSNDKYPVAAGRPDKKDLDIAFNFGKDISNKIKAASTIEMLPTVNVRTIKKPAQPIIPLLRFFRKAIKLRKSGVPAPRTPWVKDEKLCVHCGACAVQCPTQAITKGDELHTDVEKCIRCCACVKACKYNARVYETPFAELLSQYFKKEKTPQTLL